MGITIELKQLNNEELLSSHLIVYSKNLQLFDESRSIGKSLAERLLSTKENRRSVKLEQLFVETLNEYPEGVVIDDIDVMFNPTYKVDVLKILVEARKRKQYSVIWPGNLENGKLIYGEEEYPDYKVFNIADYDIVCVR